MASSEATQRDELVVESTAFEADFFYRNPSLVRVLSLVVAVVNMQDLRQRLKN